MYFKQNLKQCKFESFLRSLLRSWFDFRYLHLSNVPSKREKLSEGKKILFLLRRKVKQFLQLICGHQLSKVVGPLQLSDHVVQSPN